MDLGKIKNLVKQNGDKFIFVENGEPEMVMMSFEEYQKLLGSDTNMRMHTNDTNVADTNYSHHSREEFASLVSHQESQDSVGLPVRLEDIRLEDLPI